MEVDPVESLHLQHLQEIDPSAVPLFNPRRQRWLQHFRWDGVALVGRTPTGRATVAALRINRPIALAIREEELALGRHPSG